MFLTVGLQLFSLQVRTALPRPFTAAPLQKTANLTLCLDGWEVIAQLFY